MKLEESTKKAITDSIKEFFDFLFFMLCLFIALFLATFSKPQETINTVINTIKGNNWTFLIAIGFGIVVVASGVEIALKFIWRIFKWAICKIFKIQ